METSLTIYRPDDFARDYRAVALVSVGAAGTLFWIFLALIFLYQSLRVCVTLCRFSLVTLFNVIGLAFVLAAQPFWVIFGVVWPRALGGDALQLPPVSSEYTGERGARGLGDPNLPFEVGGRRLPVSAHLECARLRRRTVWVRRLECVLGGATGVVGAFVKGRWVPDLPRSDRTNFANLVLTHTRGGAKILGGGSVQTGEGDTHREETYLVVELPDGSRETIFPELLSRLSSYALLRKRDADLVSAMRLRALEWCKGAKLSNTVSWWAICSAIKMAWPVSDLESSVSEVIQAGMDPTLLSDQA